ncbi:MAG: DUF2683 family protein [Chitinophagales bacterium]|jgi:hypothetical protein|nr:hypothetical protein [Sphingobacteriales bacterium]
MSVITISTDKLELKDIIALKAFLKALKIGFEEKKNLNGESYNSEFVRNVEQGIKDMEENKTKELNLDEIRSLIEIE